MKTILLIWPIWLALVVTAMGQQGTCPVDMVCLTPAAARAALEAGDKAKALEVEVKDLKEKVIPQLKDTLNTIRVEYAETKGEVTILKQDKVEWMAEKELLLKLVRPKKFGVINF
jgi:hypothetical protein